MTLNEHNETVKIIRLTPPGRGAVAVVLLTGAGAWDIFARRWTGPAIQSHDRQYFGRFRLSASTEGDADFLEEVVIFSPRPDEIELHCHGGEAVVSALERSVVQDGVTAWSWKEHFCAEQTQRDLALEMLISASTARTAQILLDQYNGALERELAELETLHDAVEKRQRLERLHENAKLSKHLIQPFRVVLAGPVNAGKSSLLNSLLGFQRAIVHDLPGTTRDAVSGQTAVEGFPVEFVDTAGFRDTEHDPDIHELERQGIERSRQWLARADLVLRIFDVTALDSLDGQSAAHEIMCLNKIDLLDASDHRLPRVPQNAVRVSAVTGEGIEMLLRHIACRLVPNPPQPGEAVPLG